MAMAAAMSTSRRLKRLSFGRVAQMYVGRVAAVSAAREAALPSFVSDARGRGRVLSGSNENAIISYIHFDPSRN